MSYISYEKSGPEYQKLWDGMHIIRDANELQRLSDKLFRYKDVYQKVEKATGVPWQMIAVIHVREAGEEDIGVWKRCLHDGEKIIGNGRKTRDVPRGRGPFNTWQEAAVDALHIQGFDQIKSWPVSRILWALEPYNGYGYRNKGLRSPYLWASTNWQQPGKYVRDGVFSASTIDTQIGCAALLKYLAVDKKANTTGTTPTGAVIVAGTAAAIAAPSYAMPIGIGVLLLAAIVFYLIREHQNQIQPQASIINDRHNDKPSTDSTGDTEPKPVAGDSIPVQVAEAKVE